MKKLSTALLIVLTMLFVFGMSGCSKEATTLTLDNQSYIAGNTITVNFKIVDEIKSNAWLGIIPSDIAHGLEIDGDANDVSYQFIGESKEGSLTFNAPQSAGKYDFRLYNTDDADGIEIAYVPFEVVLPEVTEISAKLALDKDSKQFNVGDQIVVTYDLKGITDVTAWLGIVPSDTPHGEEEINDQADLSFKYLGGSSKGTFTFDAPEEPGSYDFRLNDSDNKGKELTSITFEVIGESTENEESQE